MAAFVRHFPKVRLYLWFFLPIPAWLAAVMWMIYNLWGAMQTEELGIAFIAHIVGFVTGFALSLIMYQPGTKFRLFNR